MMSPLSNNPALLYLSMTGSRSNVPWLAAYPSVRLSESPTRGSAHSLSAGRRLLPGPSPRASFDVQRFGPGDSEKPVHPKFSEVWGWLELTQQVHSSRTSRASIVEGRFV